MQPGIGKSELELFGLGRTPPEFVEGDLGYERNDVFDLRKDVTGCIHIDPISISKLSEIIDGEVYTDQYKRQRTSHQPSLH